MTHTSTEDTETMHLVTKRRKDIAAWAIKNFKAWPKPYEITDADPEEIGCELVVSNQHHLPVLRCKLGGGYVDSTTWFYAKRNPKKMTTTQEPNALRLADKYEVEGFLQDHRFAQEQWCRQAAVELRRLHARNIELEAQLSAIGAGGAEPLRKPVDDGWLQDGPLLYRLTDERRPRNRDEIIVTMANSSRTEEARTRRAGELLDAVRATAPQANQADALDAKAHAKRCGGSAKAVPLYSIPD